MKKLAFYIILAIVSIQLHAQKPAEAAASDSKLPSAAKSGSPKKFSEVIPANAVTSYGAITVHKVDEKYYFEMPDSLLNREFLVVTRFSKTAGGRDLYGGEIANQQTITFERGPSNNVFLRVVTLVSQADSSNEIYQAVVNSNLNPIAAVFPIAAFSKDTKGVVIDLTDYLKGDNQPISISPSIKKKYSMSALASDRSYISKIKSYPINTEIRTVKTFNATVPEIHALGTSSFPAAVATGAVTFEMNTSILLLPKTPMQKRFADPRVGYFADSYTEYSDNQDRVDAKIFIVRWRLEPKPEDLEKYKRGELVEPAKPIVYYIDPATPKKWVPYLMAGINDWQKAFEQAGFKNAIMAKEWPEGDSTMSLEDARYSVLRYFASPIPNAYGPNVHDPRSGEILESHIGWYHNVMELVHDWYMVQCAAVDPQARKMKLDDALMGQLIRFVSSHEIGHTLGLRHNFGSSSQTPVEKLRNRNWLEQHGHTSSIMDYARFNYVAQPEDSIPQRLLFPRIGEYDKWAIKWGYHYLNMPTPESEKPVTNRWIVDSLKANNRLWFGGENVQVRDARIQTEDLGDNAMIAGEYGIKNLQRVLKGLPEWTKEEGDLYKNLQHMYPQVVNQFMRYVMHVIKNISGVCETRKSIEQPGLVYTPVSKAMQRSAIAFMNKNVFNAPVWLMNDQIANKINQPINGLIFSIISQSMSKLLHRESETILMALESNVNRFPGTEQYTPDDMLNDLKTGIFSELSTKTGISYYRRIVQKEYVKELCPYIKLLMLIGGEGSAISLDFSASDVPTIVRVHLKKLRAEIEAAIPLMPNQESKDHLSDLSFRIKQALEADAYKN